MKRHLCISAFFALVLIPDWASACWPRGGMPAYEGAYYAPVYHGPMYYAQPVYHQPVYVQPVYLQPCIPTMPPVFQPPRVEQSKPKAGSMLSEPLRPTPAPTSIPSPSRPPVVEPVRPAAGVGSPPVRPAQPEPAPPPPEPKRGGLFEIPKNLTPDNKPTPVDLPKPEPKLPDIAPPKIDAPKLPDLDPPKIDAPKLPPIELPKGAGPKLPSLELPGSAVPSPAPAPESLIPPPNIPTPKAQDSLPPLTLPPDTPVSPPVTPPKITEVKSSPIGAARELKVSVFPASGVAIAAGFRKVGFYNHTGRDLSLTIEGRTVTLPAMTYLHAQLPPTFTWKCADKPAAQSTVPADATGLDVLIRE